MGRPAEAILGTDAAGDPGRAVADAKQRGFQARPVIGGVFIKMLDDDKRWRRWRERATQGK